MERKLDMKEKVSTFGNDMRNEIHTEITGRKLFIISFTSRLSITEGSLLYKSSGFLTRQ